MKFIAGILFSILYISVNNYAQNGSYASGARSLGMAGTSITLSDAFAAFNNIGALATKKNADVYFSSSLPYGMRRLAKVAAGFNLGFAGGTATLNFFRFGDQQFNEQKLGIGYSHKIRYVSIGLQVDYIQYRIEGYGSSGSLCFEFGGTVRISPEILFGAYIFNLTRSNPYHNNDTFPPGLLKAGISYQPVTQLLMNVEYHYYVYHDHDVSFGLEYTVRDKIALRTGVRLETLRSTFGIGFKSGRFRIDYAADVHPILGISHEFSITLNIKS